MGAGGLTFGTCEMTEASIEKKNEKSKGNVGSAAEKTGDGSFPSGEWRKNLLAV